jgi:penicillin-binding protein 1C
MLFAVFFIITLLSNWRVHLFNSSYSTIALAQNGELLGASIASDGQWRFPATAQPDPKYMQCLIAFEDQTFYGHDGIYLPSILRAISQNWQQKKIVSGGSTITMQLARISRGNPARTWFEKLIESVLAWQIEQSYTKSEILALYAAHAPFGGNVVGLDAAAWRYYGRSSKQLSWAENATLAALPNAPSLIYPGKSQHLLLEKRDFILIKLNASQQNNSARIGTCSNGNVATETYSTSTICSPSFAVLDVIAPKSKIISNHY